MRRDVSLLHMGNLDEVKRDFEYLQSRRLRAARLLSKGLSEAEVARRVGVRRQSVNRWKRQLEYSGPAALEGAGRAGRKSQLEPSDLRRVEAGLRSWPKALGESGATLLARRTSTPRMVLFRSRGPRCRTSTSTSGNSGTTDHNGARLCGNSKFQRCARAGVRNPLIQRHCWRRRLSQNHTPGGAFRRERAQILLFAGSSSHFSTCGAIYRGCFS